MYENLTSSYNFHSPNNHNSLNSSIIITPYEKVLSILNSVKQYINSTSKGQSKLVLSLDWVIKVITSHSLYAYELKEKDLINKLTKENSDFKNFVDFVSKYNDQVIEMNKKNILLGARTIDIANDLLQKPSINLKKPIEQSKKTSTPTKKIKKLKLLKRNSKIYVKEHKYNSVKGKLKRFSVLDNEVKKTKFVRFNTFAENKTTKKMKKQPKSEKNIRSERISLTAKFINNDNENKISEKLSNDFFSDLYELKESNNPKENNVESSLIGENNINSSEDYNNKSLSTEIDSLDFIEKLYNNNDAHRQRLSFKTSYTSLPFITLQKMINESLFDTKLIMQKEFNIFELEKKVGHQNVLPIMGRTMLDSFGLIDEKIMPIDKLGPFLVSVTKQYLTSTLYHNSLHGADITQTICLFFNNSNAEEVCHTQAIDLLSIIIAALGHDIGHPGLTNTFQINSLSDMAITYNDSSCLENFHLATLFKTIRKDETNIFEKLSSPDFKKIRKRMISEILATDMAIHGKILNNIRSKIPDYLLQDKNDNNNNDKMKKFELITDINNEETTSEEKQALFDYFIHSADLGHNTKEFCISLKWVELLSNEFWLQGDKERSMNLTISFLCDRKTTNVPKSQVGFIGGFIIPTYDYLVVMFPTLRYTIDNAKNNLNIWQKLADEGRKRGWTPEKNEKKKKI
jgi:cAMP-specific phosphodiesterase 4/calcium/calmodulin-dependent 3',5'-cyclic nucleotide phosphodiesterase